MSGFLSPKELTRFRDIELELMGFIAKFSPERSDFRDRLSLEQERMYFLVTSQEEWTRVKKRLQEDLNLYELASADAEKYNNGGPICHLNIGTCRTVVQFPVDLFRPPEELGRMLAKAWVVGSVGGQNELDNEMVGMLGLNTNYLLDLQPLFKDYVDMDKDWDRTKLFGKDRCGIDVMAEYVFGRTCKRTCSKTLGLIKQAAGFGAQTKNVAGVAGTGKGFLTRHVLGFEVPQRELLRKENTVYTRTCHCTDPKKANTTEETEKCRMIRCYDFHDIATCLCFVCRMLLDNLRHPCVVKKIKEGATRKEFLDSVMVQGKCPRGISEWRSQESLSEMSRPEVSTSGGRDSSKDQATRGEARKATGAGKKRSSAMDVDEDDEELLSDDNEQLEAEGKAFNIGETEERKLIKMWDKESGFNRPRTALQASAYSLHEWQKERVKEFSSSKPGRGRKNKKKDKEEEPTKPKASYHHPYNRFKIKGPDGEIKKPGSKRTASRSLQRKRNAWLGGLETGVSGRVSKGKVEALTKAILKIPPQRRRNMEDEMLRAWESRTRTEEETMAKEASRESGETRAGGSGWPGRSGSGGSRPGGSGGWKPGGSGSWSSSGSGGPKPSTSTG